MAGPTPWPLDLPGVIELPSGRRVRGRGRMHGPPDGPWPTYAVQLTAEPLPAPDWAHDSIRWPDFWLPSEPDEALRLLRAAYDRAGEDRVEASCVGGIGRTGTALSVLAVYDGMSPRAAVRWVRERYHPRAVEVPWQRLLVMRAGRLRR